MTMSPIQGCDILDAAIAEEARHNTFKRDQIRCSGIGNCPRLELASALGYVSKTIDWDYNEGGHLLEEPVERRLRRMFPRSEAQVSVMTTAPRTWTHPDHYVPELGLAIQQKSTKRRSILEYLDGVRDPVFGLVSKIKKQSKQVLLEWWFWRRAGFYVAQDGQHRREVPSRYELLYLAREDFGETRLSVPVPWDEAQADALAEEFDRRVKLLVWGEVPPHDKTEPDFECGYVRKWYDWDGVYDQGGPPCPLYERCWGRPYAPNYSTRVPRKGWYRIR